MSLVTLLSGSLGAGKTTLLINLLLNDSFTRRDGIIVMDAAGDIDYERVRRIAEEKGVRIENATSACTVCDGPESAFNKLGYMTDLDNVLIELSGQMPLSDMNSRLTSKGVNGTRNIYLVDPRNFGIVQAADEIPHAHVVGLTKSDEPVRISKYNQNASVVRIHKERAPTLDDLFKGADLDAIFPDANGHGHRHPTQAGMVPKWTGKVFNPYHTADDLVAIVKLWVSEYDRIKGYVALDSERVFSFDGVQGEFDYEIVTDPLLGNGTLLLANMGNNFFLESEAIERTAPLTEKPSIPPVVRRGSTGQTFKTFVERALAASQYDEALGAGEQYKSETGDQSLFLSTLPKAAQGKLALIESGSLTRPQRVLQAMAALWHTEDLVRQDPDIAEALSDRYKTDYAAMTTKDWDGIEAPTRGYIEEVYGRVA